MGKQDRKRDIHPAAGDWESRSRIHTLMHMAATGAGLYVCYLLALPFVSAFTWALTLAILFFPLQRRLEESWKHPGVAALISVLLAAIIVGVPTILLAERVIVEANKGAMVIKKRVESGEWQRSILSDPNLAPVGQWMESHLDISGMVGNTAPWLANLGASFVRLSVIQLVLFLVTFYLLFYFLRDRKAVLRSLRRFSPLPDREMNRLFARVADTVHATVYGTFVVAAVQGTLGGLMFWWLGLPASVLWGVVMGVLAIVPVLGAFVIWIPVALFLAFEGNWISALILTAWGTVVVGGIDNLIYPILVGNRLKLHTVPAFIAIVGGLIVFGAYGIILGPLAMTISLFLLEIWHTRFSTNLTR